jgi:hypothetical protein
MLTAMYPVAAVLLGAASLTRWLAHAQPVDDLWRRAASVVTDDIHVASTRTYTHIVVGCGLAGMTVAARLSEKVNNKVLCIEAGNDTRKDPLVETL